MTEPRPSKELSPVQQALREIRRLRGELESARGHRAEPIAIVGVGVRLPGGIDTPEELWTSLSEGVDAIGPVPEDRWDHDTLFHRDGERPGTYYVERGGFLSDVMGFDPEFFGIAALEALSMDPQQRLLLETTWEALADAGIDPSSLRGSSTGVFVGIGNGDYTRIVLAQRERIDPWATSGTSYSVASGRISYLLGLQGPAISVDTACSSSLVATHLACRSLRDRECDLAIAAGVNLILAPEVTINFCSAGMLSKDGWCKTFDAAADGYVRSEGCGVVALKRLSSAVRDGDRILAVIRGSAVNQDGRSSGLTAPNGPSQTAVIRSALASAGLQAGDVGYVEAHGTGTSLGDPIEVQALGEVFGGRGPDAEPLLIGSIKSNMGHLEAAAGVAGLIKAAQVVSHGAVPPSLHFHTPNPHIPWDRLPFRVPTGMTPMNAGEGKRRAGVSSFGFSGTNAHIILEEAPESPPVDEAGEGETAPPAHLLPLSASSPDTLRESALRWTRHLRESGDSFSELCHTAGVGRAHLPHRLALVARDAGEAGSLLEAWLEGDYVPAVRTGRADLAVRPAVAFLFQGTGFSPALLATLGEGAPAVRSILDACAEVLRGTLGASAPDLRSPGEWTIAADPAGEIERVLTVVGQLALAELWKSWGVRPDIVLGTGIGALAAGYLAGHLHLDEALNLEQVDQGKMSVSEGRRRGPTPGSPLFLSSVTGDAPDGATLSSPSHWLAEVRGGVRLSDALDEALASDTRWFVQIGPEAIRLPVGGKARTLVQVPPLPSEGDPWLALLGGMASFYVSGAAPDWTVLGGGLRRKRVVVPGPVFARRRFWFGDDLEGAAPPLPGSGTQASSPITTLHPERPSPWASSTLAATKQAALVPVEMNMASYGDKWRALNELTLVLGWNALSHLGAFDPSGGTFDTEGVLHATGIRPMYARIVDRVLRGLSERGHLHSEGDGYRLAGELLPPDPAPYWEEVEARMADDPYLLQYLRHSGRLYEGVLAGRTSPLDTLFPGGSFSLAEDLYERALVLRYVNQIARAALEGYVAGLPHDAPVRVLEVGAGTGGTTTSLLPVLPADRTTYVYTDVSDIFLQHGAEKFRAFDFVETRLFDLEGDPREQGLEPGHFDVIVGANVVHAVRDLRPTLERLRGLLAPGGLLLLVESTGHHDWHDISTGLIEGWQHFQDDLRSDSPLLEVGDWHDLITSAGFAEMDAAPRPESPASVLRQHVLLAVAPGSPRPTQERSRDGTGMERPGGPQTAPPQTPTVTPDFDAAFATRVLEAPPSEREDIVARWVRDAVMAILRSDPDRPPSRDARLMELGFDSLMAVRLRNALQDHVPEPLPATLIFDFPTIRQISELILGSLDPEVLAVTDEDPEDSANEGDRISASQAGDAGRKAAVEALTDEEAEALLLSRLERLGREGGKD